MEANPILVTQPSIAPLSELIPYLDRIWATGILTHNGPLLLQLEAELSRRLGVADTICVNNGTLALQLAIRALDLRGEIITTPFTYIATANAIAWEGCTPVFADIDPDTWNLDPVAAEKAITPATVAILPVHVFSAPCDLERFQVLADRHKLRLIYDAAHALCVDVHGRSLMSYGDISCTSFHATKLYNTGEGGACFATRPELRRRLRQLRFFGHDEHKEVVDDGTNAKMTEIAAALGLANLRHLDAVLERRRQLGELYIARLQGLPGLRLQRFQPGQYNFSYMPVLLPSEAELLRVIEALATLRVHPRRYFYPLLLDTPRFRSARTVLTPAADDVARRIVCLPLYFNLQEITVQRICDAVRSVVTQ